MTLDFLSKTNKYAHTMQIPKHLSVSACSAYHTKAVSPKLHLVTNNIMIMPSLKKEDNNALHPQQCISKDRIKVLLIKLIKED